MLMPVVAPRWVRETVVCLELDNHAEDTNDDDDDNHVAESKHVEYMHMGKGEEVGVLPTLINDADAAAGATQGELHVCGADVQHYRLAPHLQQPVSKV